MSTLNLKSRIEEEHLTCTICFNVFNRPKALPCLHTFCEHCLREYVVSRGFESDGEFPCPICRKVIAIPPEGLSSFPDNHLVKSLSDTVDKSSSRPTPKPRRSLGVQPKADDTSISPPPSYSQYLAQNPYPGANASGGGEVGAGYPSPPSYPGQPGVAGFGPPFGPPLQPSLTYPEAGADLPVKTLPNSPPPNQYPPGAPLYPTLPPPTLDTGSAACSEGLVLRFGKKGGAITDFHKPFGLAVSENCDFVVTDLGGNRIFVFSNSGEPKKAFKCDCTIKDVTVNNKNEILVVVNKSAAGLRCYNLSGRFLGEHGKFITYEETQGIAAFHHGGAVITGVQNHVVYIMTDQYKQSQKFGRKGTGDGYFQCPGFVATDTKDHIIVSDSINNNIQVFSAQGKFKLRFGGEGSNPGYMSQPMGVCTDSEDNIIVADSGNYRVEMFSNKGRHLRTIVNYTHRLGEGVRPVNVAMTPRGHVAVLLKGPYFAEIRVYSLQSNASYGPASVKDSTTWYLVN